MEDFFNVLRLLPVHDQIHSGPKSEAVRGTLWYTLSVPTEKPNGWSGNNNGKHWQKRHQQSGSNLIGELLHSGRSAREPTHRH